jgi:hypothetical protein
LGEEQCVANFMEEMSGSGAIGQMRSIGRWRLSVPSGGSADANLRLLEASVSDHVAQAVDVDEDAVVVGGDAGRAGLIRRRAIVVASVALPDGRSVRAAFAATIQRLTGTATVRPTGNVWIDRDGAAPRADESAATPAVESEVAANPVGAGLALLGAILVLVGSFVPIHSLGSLPIANNSFVSGGDWWILALPLAMGVTAAYLLLEAAEPKAWRIVVPSLIALGVGIYGQTSKFQTLQLSDLGQQLLGQQSVKASAGAGVWLVLAGGVLGLAGAGILSGRWQPAGAPDYGRRTKKCPDCAERILADANVCKHCGYRFQDAVMG